MLITLTQDLTMSVVNHDGSYSDLNTVEIGFPSKEITELNPYKVGDDDPRESVYSYVPIPILANIIQKYHTTS
jgi:hypothetical protein